MLREHERTERDYRADLETAVADVTTRAERWELSTDPHERERAPDLRAQADRDQAELEIVRGQR
ncbi:hypothetical protein [Georgenia yuyongxinii]|uniref:Uncharacterized protein n=1 Tax=Georgenia yuyongxinii TaxID=2589797 RepID=A0A552WU84_9MICO|nr:hypothetical protein [Georgenia yuyongxinii]TRW46410.1 hypothetical protein FJ693_05645 [Georgenia yuyongxinii]